MSFATAIAATFLAAQAMPAPSVADLRQGLAGEWSGALGYRDYQSDRLIELPVAVSITAVADGETQVRTSRFDEGRGRAPVWTTTVSRAVADGRVESAFFRAGRPVDVQAEQATLARYDGPTRWSIVYAQTGTDDDRPA